MSNIPETGRTPRVQIRLVVLQILVLSLLATLGGRLWYLQIRNGQEYAAEASGNHVQQVVQPAPRGEILDARGVPLADNETRLVVSASRTDLMKMDDGGKAVLTKLAGVLGMKPQEVMEKVRLCDAKTPRPCWNGSPYQPIPITDKATARQALEIRERSEDFPGISAEPEAVRRYPSPGMANAAQVLGYLSPVTDDEVKQAEDTDSPLLRSDQIGRSGLERQYDSALRGKAGVTRYEVDNLGRVIGKAESDPGVPGSNLVTSIDSRVQRVAEYELDTAMKAARQQFDTITNKNYKADSGAVVVMEAKTGRIVAMASAPTYDPNVWIGGISAKDYKALTGKKSDYPLLNRAIQGEAAPGSTFKVVSTAAAVQAGYRWNGGYPCTSSYTAGGRVFKNFEGENFGPISLGRALEVSCDTVFYGLADNEWKKDGGINPKKGQPKDYFFKTAHQFGLGKTTGVDLPNEIPGRIPDRKWKQDYWEANKDSWCKTGKKNGSYVEQIAYENCREGNKMREGDTINYSIGQGDTLVTPIQEAMIYGAVANGGTEYVPTIGKAVISPDGKTVREIKPQEVRKLPVSKATLKGMDDAFAGVITRGTAAWKFGGWPQNKIPLHAKTGTAEVYGKQTTSWLATYSKDYTVIMTISQAGTGSGASGEAVRNIYGALYGVQADGSIDKKKALLPTPQKGLPKVAADGTIDAPDVPKDAAKQLTENPAPTQGGAAGDTGQQNGGQQNGGQQDGQQNGGQQNGQQNGQQDGQQAGGTATANNTAWTGTALSDGAGVLLTAPATDAVRTPGTVQTLTAPAGLTPGGGDPDGATVPPRSSASRAARRRDDRGRGGRRRRRTATGRRAR